ncbi:MAG: MFS transporter [Lachnospiraceae bacterium]|jgi:GPH family glycoside/pentoside/hexuronide:cation symporter|nr:MFS transporter [Lachnospiraceae bacterium]MDE6918782.1 glycoside-pentoside-hexuronide (GPH):cation symporter [Lachnospiraceae bacterium]
MEKRKKKFGVKDQICYLFGDVGGSFVNLYVDAYFLVFCTYVLGVSTYFMGTLFLVARIWDAINDPLMGSIPDRHMLGKSGDRFKPYIKLFMVPLALSGVLCFTDVSGFADLWKHAWVCFAYIAYGMCYTGASMPYGSLATVITSDPVENAKLSRARSFGGAIVGILLAVVPQFIYDKDTNPVPAAFFVIAIIFGLGSILAYTILLSGSTERIHYEVKRDTFKYGEVLKNCMHNRPLIGCMVAAVGFLFYNTGFGQISSYMFKEYYHDTSIITFATLITMPLMLLIFPMIPKLVRRFGKVGSVLYPCLGGVALCALLFFIPIRNPWIYLALNAVAVIGPMCYALNCWAIVSDCIEYHEYKFGQRANGSIYSIYTFSRKIGSALASAFASYSLGLIGYVSGVNEQTAEVAGRIRYLVTAVPLIACVLICVGLGLIFNLKKEQSAKIHEELERKHAEEGTV